MLHILKTCCAFDDHGEDHDGPSLSRYTLTRAGLTLEFKARHAHDPERSIARYRQPVRDAELFSWDKDGVSAYKQGAWENTIEQTHREAEESIAAQRAMQLQRNIENVLRPSVSASDAQRQRDLE